MQHTQTIKPQVLNIDKSPKHLGENESFYLLNHEVNTNGAKDSLGTSTPIIANYQGCEIDQPLGENYSIGGFESKLTNEDYDFVFNSNGAHYIKRINSKGECEIVYQGGCFNLSADPKHSIENWRCYMKIDKLCKNAHGKQMIWTDGLNPIGQIDVEASIATNFFTTPFFDICPDPCAYIRMCVPQPCEIITAEFIALVDSDKKLPNKIFNRTFQYIYRHVYYDGRASEWSKPSTTYFSDTGICLEFAENNAPRCMKLRIPIGNPLVEKIEIGYREDTNDPQWYLYDTIEKYNPYSSPNQFWYERTLSPTITSANFSDCAFDYIFCNDKQCQSIPVVQTNRVYNPMPIQPQGLIPFKDSVGFYNYIQGNCPLSKNEIDKFEIKPVANNINCHNDLVKVTVRAVISSYKALNQFILYPQNQCVFRLGGFYGDNDDLTDDAMFGGYEDPFSSQSAVGPLSQGFGQTFSNKRRNFVAYIEGTSYFGEMEQWMAKKGFTERKKVGIVSGGSKESTYARLYSLFSQGYFFYQEYTFLVPRGSRGIIRLANHVFETGQHYDTSARLGKFDSGIIQNINQYILDSTTHRIPVKEIKFDTCTTGDFETVVTFEVIAVCTANVSIAARYSFSGYILDKKGRRVEFAEIWILMPGNVWEKQTITDHNGFFSFDTYSLQDVEMQVRGELSATGAWEVIGEYVLNGEANKNKESILTVQNASYTDSSYVTVKVPVKDCNNKSVSGVRVAMTESKYSTSADGIAEFTIRNNPNRSRHLNFYLMDNKGCFSYGCTFNCNACMPYGGTPTPSTYFTTPIQVLNPFFLPQNNKINTNYISSTVAGLKSGGRYPFGFVVEGDCGIISAVNELPYLDVPRVQEKNDLVFSNFQYNGNGITFPSSAKCLHIVRGDNINKYELQWIVDKVEFIDGNTKIKLTIQSLNDFNANYLFNTNTKYQWVKGDRIEFIRNGDNKIFSFANYPLLLYQTISPLHDITISGLTTSAGVSTADANYFNQLLIENDGKLDDLVAGAVIELQRLPECQTEPTYYSIGVSIPIVNGKLLYDSGTFHTFDTYLVKRIVSGRILQEFEHHSPSDFWGDRVTDIGKPYFRNKYENQKRFGRAITINSRNQFNHFGDIVKLLPNPEHGDITSMWIYDDKIITVIGEKDNCILSSADELLRLNSQGVVVALPADSIISDPQPKLSGVFGCKYEDIGSVFYGDGWFTYLDSAMGALIKHNFETATDISEGRTSTYFRKRCQEVAFFNNLPAQTNTSDPLRFLNHLRYISGYNNHTGVFHLTIKALRDAGINNEKEPYLKPNETLRYDPAANQFLGFCSYTPERYSNLNLEDKEGCSMICYYNTIPWIHPVISDIFDSFFGVSVDRVVGIVLNKYSDKTKSPFSLEIQDEKMWYASKVETDKPNTISEIPPIKVKKDGRKWNAPFQKNINSIGGLFNGSVLSGYWCAITLVRDNTIQNQYNSINPDKQKEYDELDNIIIKFGLAEQSGFTENI